MYTAAMTTAKKKLTLGDYMKTVIAREGRIMCVCVAVVAVVVAGDGRGEFGMERLLFFFWYSEKV